MLGLTSDVVDRALPYLTVYSGNRRSLNAASEVLAALPGLTPGRIQNRSLA